MTDQTADDRVYLLLDDHGARIRQFQEHISTEQLTIETASEANELAAMRQDLEVLDGAIVDFHLNTPTRADYPYLRYPCTEADCPDIAAAGGREADVARAHREHAWHATAGIPEVNVTTGIGAMLYIKQHAPDTALYGFCELSANHSLMFLLAARAWLQSSAINAETPAEAIQQALMSDAPEDFLPINRQLAQAEAGFTQLTDSLTFLTRSAEAFDWLNVYRQCGYRGSLAEFKNMLRERFDVRTLEADIYIEIMCKWQAALTRIMMAFGMDTSGWPDLRNVRSAKHWDQHNPVLDFLKSHDYHTFFTAPDTRAALAYHRANQLRIAAESPLGGY